MWPGIPTPHPTASERRTPRRCAPSSTPSPNGTPGYRQLLWARPHGGPRAFHQKSSCLHVIYFRASGPLCGANQVTLPLNFRGPATFVVHRVVSSKQQVWHTDEAKLYYYGFKTSTITILEPFWQGFSYMGSLLYSQLFEITYIVNCYVSLCIRCIYGNEKLCIMCITV